MRANATVDMVQDDYIVIDNDNAHILLENVRNPVRLENIFEKFDDEKIYVKNRYGIDDMYVAIKNEDHHQIFRGLTNLTSFKMIDGREKPLSYNIPNWQDFVIEYTEDDYIAYLHCDYLYDGDWLLMHFDFKHSFDLP